jgi:hypothetical protein
MHTTHHATPYATHATGSLRKITSQADNRMRTRTAKQQLADALAASAAERKPPAFPAPDDGDDSSARRNNIIGA